MLCRPAFTTLTFLAIYLVFLVIATAFAANKLKESLLLLGYILCFYLFTILCLCVLIYFEEGKAPCDWSTGKYDDSDGSSDIELSYYPTEPIIYTSRVTITMVNEEDNDKVDGETEGMIVGKVYSEDGGENDMVDGKVDMVDGQYGVGDNGVDDNGVDDNGVDDNGVDDNGVDDNGVDDNGVDDNGENDVEDNGESDGKVDMVDGQHDADDNGEIDGENNGKVDMIGGQRDVDDNGESDSEIDFETDGEDEDEEEFLPEFTYSE